LKNQMPHGTPKVPISLSDNQISRISPIAWKPRQIELPVSKEVIFKYDSADRPKTANVPLVDSTVLNEGKIKFMMNGVPYQNDIRILRVQDIMVHEIVTNNKWERPIYFAVTCSPDSKIGLDQYLWMQGLTYKLKPKKIGQNELGIDYDIMAEQLMAENVKPSKTFQRGYLFRNLNDKNVYYDENVQRMVMNYRFNFIRLAEYAMREKNDIAAAKKVLRRMEDVIPIDVIPNKELRINAYIMNLYNQLGENEFAEKYAKILETSAWDMINTNRFDEQDQSLPYTVLLDIYDRRKDYSSAINLLNRALVQYPNDPNLKARIQYYEQKLKESSVADTSKPK
jgi:hypothetical protein